MKALFGNLTKGLPSLLGVLAGIFLYQPGLRWTIPILFVLLVSILLMQLGKWQMKRDPVLGSVLIEFWIFSAISIVAASTIGILWLTVNAPSFFNVAKDQQEALAGALVGGMTTFLATLWMKDIEDAAGPFWTSTQFKKGLQAAFGKEPLAPPGDTLERDAVFEDYVRDGTEGWGFEARGRRAKIMAEYLREHNRGRKLKP